MYSRLTAQFRAAIPREMRELLRVGPGDIVKHEIVDGRIVLSKATAKEIDSWLNVKVKKRAKADADAEADVNAIVKRTPRYKVRETYGSYGKL